MKMLNEIYALKYNLSKCDYPILVVTKDNFDRVNYPSFENSDRPWIDFFDDKCVWGEMEGIRICVAEDTFEAIRAGLAIKAACYNVKVYLD